MSDQFLCHFASLQFTQRYWELPPIDRQQVVGAFGTELQAGIPHHALYQVFPTRNETDMLLWSSFQVTSPEQPADIFQCIAGVFNAHQAYLHVGPVYWGLTRPSDYSKAKSSQEVDPFSPDHKTYLVVYPFTKTADWYRLGRDARQGMMNEHIRTGHQYPQIAQILLYSTGLQDQEFVVAYETDDLGQFSTLVTDLRQSDARIYTLGDTPVFTGVYRPGLDTLSLFV